MDYIRANYRNTGPLQKYPAVTETPNRYSNTESLQKQLVGWCFEPSQPQRVISGRITETLGRYRNIKPLQKHPTVTATPRRRRNTQPLQKHKAVAISEPLLKHQGVSGTLTYPSRKRM